MPNPINQQPAQESSQLVCRCLFGTITKEDRRTAAKLFPDEGPEFDGILEDFRIRYDKTRTGHNWGCPKDVEAYRPGEFYCHAPLTWANGYLLPTSNFMLTTGVLNPRHESFAQFKNQASAVGVYRKK